MFTKRFALTNKKSANKCEHQSMNAECLPSTSVCFHHLLTLIIIITASVNPVFVYSRIQLAVTASRSVSVALCPV